MSNLILALTLIGLAALWIRIEVLRRRMKMKLSELFGRLSAAETNFDAGFATLSKGLAEVAADQAALRAKIEELLATIGDPELTADVVAKLDAQDAKNAALQAKAAELDALTPENPGPTEPA